MRKLSRVIISLLCLAALFLNTVGIIGPAYAANTAGTVTFKVQTVLYSADYDPKNVGAIWVEDSAGNFVKTLKVWAASQKSNLSIWKTASGSNTVDAVTSATISSNQLHTVTWNCTDVSRNVVPDGDYRMRVEYTSNNNSGKDMTPIVFTKGTSAVNLTPTAQTYFTNLSIIYAPTVVPVPSAPTSLVATPGNANVLLTYAASSGATSYNIKRATVSGGPYTQVATGITTTSYTNTGLTNGTTYYYVVSAVNASGESANSAQVSATPQLNLGAPNPVTDLKATPSNGMASLSWTATPGATSYNVKRATVSGGPYTQITSGLTATSYNNAGLTNGTTYYYVVTAVNAIGESANSNVASVVPAVPPSITFADANLDKIVRGVLEKPTGTIYVSDTVKITTLTITGNVVNLSGLEKITTLTTLSLYNNKIVNVTPLASLTNLVWLDISKNSIVSISPLSTLTKLKDFYANNNQIVDVTAIAQMTSLTTLSLANNKIASISSIGGLLNLEALYLNDNLITTLPTLASANLKNLNLSNNPILNYTPISPRYAGLVDKDFTILPSFVVSRQRFTDVSGNPVLFLAPSTTLRTSVEVTNISALAQQPKLIVVLYDQYGKVVKVSTAGGVVAAGTKTTITLDFVLPASVDKTFIKALVWNDLQGIKPLSEMLVINSFYYNLQ